MLIPSERIKVSVHPEAETVSETGDVTIVEKTFEQPPPPGAAPHFIFPKTSVCRYSLPVDVSVDKNPNPVFAPSNGFVALNIVVIRISPGVVDTAVTPDKAFKTVAVAVAIVAAVGII